MTSHDYCQGSFKELQPVADYILKLKYAQEPNYEKIIEMFESIITSYHQVPSVNLFQWI